MTNPDGRLMATSLVEIEQQASLLSPDDRAKLAEFLLESLQEPALAEVTQEWDREIARRVAAYNQGPSSIFAAEDVFAEAKHLTR